MTGARHIIDRIGVCVMIAMIRDPRAGRARAIEARKENQNLLNDRMQLNRAMREAAMVADGCAKPTRARHD